jgi:hypothetical protein
VPGARARARSVRLKRSVRQPEHGQARRQAGAGIGHGRLRAGRREHPGQVGGRRGGVQRDHHPAGAEDGDQGGGIAERVRQADGYPGAERHPSTVQAPGLDPGGAPQADIDQYAGSPAVIAREPVSACAERLGYQQ